MKAYCFFSVYERLFREVAEQLRDYGVRELSGFVWGEQQAKAITGRGVEYQPLVVFTRDLLPQIRDGQPPDIAWLERREREIGVSIQRMLASERHLLAGRAHEQILRMAEVALRTIGAALDEARPDFVFSEDVSCFHSYAHFALARERGIPFWAISTGRLRDRISVYSSGLQRWETLGRMFGEVSARGLTDEESRQAATYVEQFQNRPARPTGMDVRAKHVTVGREDVSKFFEAASRYFGDRHDPTLVPPTTVIKQRLTRIGRVRLANALGVWDRPVDGEKYVLFPLHFQPEATTLVQAPLYVDQLALIQDMAKSLPIDCRLYVKEHVSSRGRRPISYYRALRAIPSVRLLAPDEDTWTLIRNASAVAVITGTVGWEGLLFDKPVVTFGEVFFNQLPHVYRAGAIAKDNWYALFRDAIESHKPDRSALFAMIVALHRASYPGFIANPQTFPQTLEPENIKHLTSALAHAAGLHPPHAYVSPARQAT